ncbi:glutamate--cysteine ligase [compost metagenome]
MLSAAAAAIAEPAVTPSARVLREMEHSHDRSHLRFGLAQSLQHRKHLLELPWTTAAQARHAQLAEDSRRAQAQIEAADTMPFESYRRQYLALELLS